MLWNMLNDLAEAIRRWTEKKWGVQVIMIWSILVFSHPPRSVAYRIDEQAAFESPVCACCFANQYTSRWLCHSGSCALQNRLFYRDGKRWLPVSYTSNQGIWLTYVAPWTRSIAPTFWSNRRQVTQASQACQRCYDWGSWTWRKWTRKRRGALWGREWNWDKGYELRDVWGLRPWTLDAFSPWWWFTWYSWSKNVRNWACPAQHHAREKWVPHSPWA